jgi:uncharacterized protein YydD (DUF2326 family)
MSGNIELLALTGSILEIERLGQELAALNARIEELEKQHPEASRIEALRVSALVLARQIDEIRCSSAKDLTDLLASRAAIARDLSNHSRPGVRSQAAGYQEGDHD